MTYVTTWVNLVGFVLNETKQSQKDEYFKPVLICGDGEFWFCKKMLDMDAGEIYIPLYLMYYI